MTAPDAPSILLVEDNPDDEELTLLALRESRVANRVDVVRDGEEALRYLLGGAQVPQLVLLDLKLPKIDGLQVLKRIRAERRTAFVPVVVLTTSNEERDLIESYAGGANSYIRKPVDFERFSRAIRELSVYWLVLNECPEGLRF
jgi:two-component system response regulator